MKILIAGDTHRDVETISRVICMARANECKQILQVGDFGYYPQDKYGQRFLELASEELVAHDIELGFIDGNHDDHYSLKQIVADPEFVVEVAPNIHYLPRGYAWNWNGVTFMGVGGAYSVDKSQRTPFIDWWPMETLSAGETYQILENSPDSVDVLITHDVPSTCEPTMKMAGIRGGASWYSPTNEDLQHRAALGEIFQKVQPSMVFHGHWHAPYRGKVLLRDGSQCLVRGLGAFGDIQGITKVLDLKRVPRKKV